MRLTETHIKNLIQTRWVLLLFGLCFAIPHSQAQVTTSIDTTLIRIGEEITYTITVEADTTALVLFPEGQSFRPLEVIESYPVDTSYLEARYRLIKKYGLTQFDSGAYKLPAQRIMVDDRALSSDSAFVMVRDVPVDTTKQKMFDIKPAIEVEGPPIDWKKLLWWLLPILVIGGIVYFFFRRKKKREEKAKRLPPYEEALEALRELDESHFLEENKNKAYYSALTEIVKKYLDREVDDTALESTSDELIERLYLHRDAGHFDFDGETINNLDQLLKRADLVKFAKMRQEKGQARADRSLVEEIINETKEAIPEPTEEELRENEEYMALMQKKKRRRKRIQGVAAAFTVIVLTIVVVGLTQGWDTVKDNLLGNKMKDLAEARWYKSEYGNPAVIVETPEVLLRKPIPFKMQSMAQISKNDYFEYGVFGEFYIAINTATFAPQIDGEGEIDLNASMEEMIQAIEDAGGLNIIVKQESFSTEGGIEGLKAYGDFNLKLPDGKIRNQKAGYELLLFKQGNGLQAVLMSFDKEDFYATEIKNRVINSVELELQNPAQVKPKKEEE